jgi:hypothetical protein
LTGLRGIKATPVKGMYEGNKEPAFVLEHPNMTPEIADKLGACFRFWISARFYNPSRS